MTKDHNPIISVVMATFNAESYIRSAIDSFLKQDLAYKELIVVDGASKDGTKDILEEYAKSGLKFLSEPDKGIYDAWNKGIKLATGRWVHFLGSDDYYQTSQTLSATASFLTELPPEISMFSTSIEFCRRGAKTLQPSGTPEDIRVGVLNKGTMYFSPHPGIFHKREAFHEHGFFNPNFKIAGDYELVARWLTRSYIASNPRLATVVMNEGGVSDRLGGSFKVLGELINARKVNNLSCLDADFFDVALRYTTRGLIYQLLGENLGANFLSAAKKFYKRLPNA